MKTQEFVLRGRGTEAGKEDRQRIQAVKKSAKKFARRRYLRSKTKGEAFKRLETVCRSFILERPSLSYFPCMLFFYSYFLSFLLPLKLDRSVIHESDLHLPVSNPSFHFLPLTYQ